MKRNGYICCTVPVIMSNDEKGSDSGVLLGYKARPNESAVLCSREKLHNAANDLRTFVERDGFCSIASIPCETEEGSLAYRCKCSFQVVEAQDGTQVQYATRHKGKPVALGTATFPIANLRIQMAMKGLLEQVLNNESKKFSLISNNLASVTLVASWNDGFDNNNPVDPFSDCIITLNYDSALEHENEHAWKQEARQACFDLKLTQLHGRSRKRLLSAVTTNDSLGNNNVLRDTIWLIPDDSSRWKVSLCPRDNDGIAVHYQKPENAFFHPNARVMCQALEWILNRISTIVRQSSAATTSRLLEMYCGCGAHTVALAKARLVNSILAVEMDRRLVNACQVNIDMNNLSNGVILESQSAVRNTLTQVVHGDAGKWAKEQQRRIASPEDSEHYPSYNILLVDPPRQGLDGQVIDMAIHVESFEHVLIISCGHEALVRDLKTLSCEYAIVDCVQLDLFPRTDSVETLVHLKRRKRCL